MTAETKDTSPLAPAAEPITVEDLKHRAEEIGNLATSLSRRVADKVAQQSATRVVLVATGVVVLTAGVAFLLGRRAVLRRLQ